MRIIIPVLQKLLPIQLLLRRRNLLLLLHLLRKLIPLHHHPPISPHSALLNHLKHLPLLLKLLIIIISRIRRLLLSPLSLLILLLLLNLLRVFLGKPRLFMIQSVQFLFNALQHIKILRINRSIPAHCTKNKLNFRMNLIHRALINQRPFIRLCLSLFNTMLQVLLLLLVMRQVVLYNLRLLLNILSINIMLMTQRLHFLLPLLRVLNQKQVLLLQYINPLQQLFGILEMDH